MGLSLHVPDSAKRSQRNHFMEEDFSRLSNTLVVAALPTTAMCLHLFCIISLRAPFTLFPVSYVLYTLLLNKRGKKKLYSRYFKFCFKIIPLPGFEPGLSGESQVS